ncbi:MAG: alpha/beta fold hydrolase [Acidobacteria bacterium]|nr:alpha/beta fold hydrolase [Acidobacteriota bacterium]
MLDLPAAGPPTAHALVAHCFTCGKDLKSLVRLCRALAARGLGVLRFDFTGIGESEGQFAGTTFSSNIGDVLAAVAFLREERRAPAILLGHSLGGTAILAAAARVPEARLVATIAAPSDTATFRETLLRLAPDLEARGTGDIVLGGRRFTLGADLLADLDRHDIAACARTLGKPLVVFHSPQDETLPVEHGYRLFEAASEPRSFVALDGADHLLLQDQRHVRFVADVIAAWAARDA